MASQVAGVAPLQFPNHVSETPAMRSSDLIIVDEPIKKARQGRWRSLSSVSGHHEIPSREYSLSLEQLHRSSSVSALAETPEEMERSIRKRWTIPWRWSRMRKAYQRKTVKVAGSQSSAQLNRSPLKSNSSIDPPFPSEHYSREEIGTVIKDETRRGRGGDVRNTTTSLSLKYQPRVFEEIVGQKIIVKAISSAIKRKRISSLYLFHGPSGTGKTSTARILAMALSCESNSPVRPCWSCRGCARSLYVMEMCSGSRFAGFEKVKTLIQSTSFTQAIPGLKVFIIEERHLLTVDAWDELVSIAEGANGSTMVFVLITAEAEVLPVSILSRCQKYCFAKLKDEDIELKLSQVAIGEKITLEREAMELIIAKADGSLREAENILDQLTLLDRRISTSMVQQIVHLIPRERLNDLLMAALSGDTMKTIKFTSEIIGSGIEPQALMSQLASLVKDLLSSTATAAFQSSSAASVNGPSEKLCFALEVLVGVEKQSRSFIDHSTHIYAALLQIASQDAPKEIPCRKSRLRDERKPKVQGDEANQESLEVKQQTIPVSKTSSRHSHGSSMEYHGIKNFITNEITEESNRYRGKAVQRGTSNVIGHIEEIWLDVLGRIQNLDMKEFLSHKVKLVSLTVSSANAIVHLIFKTPEDKMKAQRSEENLAKALESAIGCPVTVNMSMKPFDLRVIRQDADTIPKSHPAECSHSKKQQRAPVLEDSIHSNSSQAAPMKYCISRVSSSHSPEQKLPIAELLPQEKQLNDSSYQGTNGLAPPARAHALRIGNPKHRRISSIPQSDASIEAYSQDILFENINKDRDSRARRNLKLQSSFSKVQEHYPDVATRIEGLDRSWSCKDIFCQQKRKGKDH